MTGGSPKDAGRPGNEAAGEVATDAPPSVAILVDDLATWVVGGLQPTGIQRVVSELLDTAYARPDIRAWPAVSVFGTAGSGRPRLTEVPRAALTWGPRTDEPGTRLRLLRSARGTVARIPLPSRARRALKEAYLRVSLPVGGVEAVQGTSALDPPDVFVVPGSFWNGDSAKRLLALAGVGIRPRVIVYDLFPLTDREWCAPEVCDAFAEALSDLVGVFERVVTLSQDVADQVDARYPDLAGRIRVAVPTLEAHAPRTAPGRAEVPPVVDGPYLLALSTVEPRKNVRAILDAWRIVRTDPRTERVRLVVAGRRGWRSDEIEAEIARDGETLGIVRLDHVTDPQVDALYRDCLATVHASWAEGFGLPARESVVRGIPTLMSSTIPRDGLPDGTYALFDPADPAALAMLILDVIERRPTRTPIALGPGTGWEPVLSALVD